MNGRQNFGILYVLLVIGQVILCNYASLGPYVMLSMLPAMVLCIPTTVSTTACMLIAFASGLAVDWLSEGIIGLNASAILPVAFMRKSIIRIFLGEDLITRGDRFSFRKNGFSKIAVALSVMLAVYLGIYVFLDGAGVRPAGFNLIRFGVSFACNFILSLIVINVLAPDDRK